MRDPKTKLNPRDLLASLFVSGHGAFALDEAAWRATVWLVAYDDLCSRVNAGEETEIDPYASESPAECFAVLSEYFFEAPHVLHADYPDVYGLLAQFYRQEPLMRCA